MIRCLVEPALQVTGQIPPGQKLAGGFCPGGFCPGGYCPEGYCPGGFCPGGFCLRTSPSGEISKVFQQLGLA